MPPLHPKVRNELYQHLAAGEWKAIDELIAKHLPRSQNDFRPVDDAALEALATRLDKGLADRKALTRSLCCDEPGPRCLALLCLKKLKKGICPDTLRKRIASVQREVHREDDRWRKDGLGAYVYDYSVQHIPNPVTGAEDYRTVVRHQDCVGREIREQVCHILRGIVEQEESAAFEVAEEFKPFLKRVADKTLVKAWFELRTARRKGSKPARKAAVNAEPARRTKKSAGGAVEALHAALASGDLKGVKAILKAAPKSTVKAFGLDAEAACTELGRRLPQPVVDWLADAVFDGPDSASAVAMALIPYVPKFPADQLLDRQLQLLRGLKTNHQGDGKSMSASRRGQWTRGAACLLLHGSDEIRWKLLIPCSANRGAADLIACGLVRLVGTSRAGGVFAALWDSVTAGPDPTSIESVARLECLREYIQRLLEPESYRDDPERESSRDWVRPKVPSGLDEYLRQVACFQYADNAICGFMEEITFRDVLVLRGRESFAEYRASFDKHPLVSKYSWQSSKKELRWQQVAREMWAIHWATGDWRVLEQQAWPFYRTDLLGALGKLKARLLFLAEHPEKYCHCEDHGQIAVAMLLMPSPDPTLIALLQRAFYTGARDRTAWVELAFDIADCCHSTKPWWNELLEGWLGDPPPAWHRGWRALLRTTLSTSRDAAGQALARIARLHPGKSTASALCAVFGPSRVFASESEVPVALAVRDLGSSGFRDLSRGAARDRLLRVCLEELADRDPELASWHWKLRHGKDVGYMETAFYQFTEDELAGYLASPSSAAIVAQTAADLLAGRKDVGRNMAARVLMQHAARLRQLGHDPVAIAVQALWGQSSAATNIALRVLRSLLAQGQATHQEIADHVEPLLESEEEDAWRGAAKFLKELRAESPAVTLRKPRRVQELINRDPKRYEKVFKGLLDSGEAKP